MPSKLAGRQATRIVSYKEYIATPRTAEQIASYWSILAALQRMGMVDENLKIVARPSRT